MRDEKFCQLQNIVKNVSRETYQQLITFETAFIKWNAAINLTSSSTLHEFWERHVIDSAKLLNLAPEAKNWLDLGSGGGLPGLVLAILLKEREGASIDLVESNRKKASFLMSVVSQSKAPARIHSVRIESTYEKITRPDIITARALAPLCDLFELTEPWMKGKTRALFHKGRGYVEEIENSSKLWAFDLVKHYHEESPGVILEISNLVRK